MTNNAVSEREVRTHAINIAMSAGMHEGRTIANVLEDAGLIVAFVNGDSDPKRSYEDILAEANEGVARVAHEVNRAWCEFNGDTSQPAWDDAPDWQRSSAINGVIFHFANPDAGDSASHDSWMAEKVAAGWVYGPEKSPDATPPTHPCIVPFDQLPLQQQFKDRLFRTIVHAS